MAVFKMEIKGFLLLLLIIQNINGETVNDIVSTPCSTNGTLINYNIYSNKIAQFFSPNFPQTLIANATTTSCEARFYTVIEDYRIWMALYNGQAQDITVSDDNGNDDLGNVLDSNREILTFSPDSQAITFKMDSDFWSKWTAFQGVVIAYDPRTTQCPFSGHSINFTNAENNLIIPINAGFGGRTSETRCHWTFNTSPGQYLKIVIKFLNVNNNVRMELRQNGQLIKRFNKNVIEQADTEVYFFPGDAGPFILYYNDTNDASAETYFSALISDASIPLSSITEQCQFSTDGKNIKVFNLDYQNGYKANQKCDYSITTHENQEIIVDVSVFFIEQNVDTLFLTFGQQKYPLTDDGYFSLHLKPGANNSLISFSADSNVQQAGFEITLESYDCQCPPSDIVIPCGSYGIELDPLGMNPDNPFYCDGMSCKYNISKNSTCTQDWYQFSLEAKIRNNVDLFNIYVNGVLQETLDEEYYYDRYFTGDTNLTVEYNSGVSENPVETDGSFWRLSLKEAQLPQFYITLLRESVPYFAKQLQDVYSCDIISVCSPEHDTLELIVASERKYLQNYILYEGKGFENFIGKLDSPQIFQNSTNFGRIISTSTCFTIHKTRNGPSQHPIESGIFLFRMIKSHNQNCQNTNNIMLLQSEYANFQNTAGPNGTCEILILSPLHFPFPFFIDSMDGTFETMFTLKSAINQNIFAKINSTEFPLWKSLQLYTAALSILIPPTTTFSMNAAFGIGMVQVEMDGQKGIMASASYGDNIDYGSSDPLYNIFPIDFSQFITAEFYLRSITGNEGVIITSNFYNHSFHLTTSGQSLTINGTELQVLNSESSTNDSFIIDYVLNLNPLTTDSPPIENTTTPMPSSSTTTPTYQRPSPGSSSQKTLPSQSTTITPHFTINMAISMTKRFSSLLMLTMAFLTTFTFRKL